MPIEYIESLPMSVLDEFTALNALSPFTHDAQAYREGLMTTLIYNNNVSKKSDAKSVQDLFPYLSGDTPEWIEDDRIKKAKDLLKSIQCHLLDAETYEQNYSFIKHKIQEEISMEKTKPNPDKYVIDKLEGLIKESN